MFADMEALKTLMLHARDNAKEVSRTSVNAARSLEQTLRDAARDVGQSASTFYTRDYAETEA